MHPIGCRLSAAPTLGAAVAWIQLRSPRCHRFTPLIGWLLCVLCVRLSSSWAATVSPRVDVTGIPNDRFVDALPVVLPMNLETIDGQRTPGRPLDSEGTWSLENLNEESAKPAHVLTAQFLPDAAGSATGQLVWLQPLASQNRARYRIVRTAPTVEPVMHVKAEGTSGLWHVSECGQPVLSYQYGTNAPVELLAQIAPANHKYAHARSDYLHPLYGLDGAVLTRDWPVDHPHHRGIYWAWPEVDYAGERGDLHAHQRVFARPTGKCQGAGGVVCASLVAENLWWWDGRVPIVHEQVRVRAWRRSAQGRFIDLEFRFEALTNGISIARRGTTHYGGLNVRLAPVREQQILGPPSPTEARPPSPWGDLSGFWPNSSSLAGLAVMQHPANPQFPGEWIQYPEINWFQPTFPKSGTRFSLSPGQPLELRFRLWIHAGRVDAAALDPTWEGYAHPPQATLVSGL